MGFVFFRLHANIAGPLFKLTQTHNDQVFQPVERILSYI